MVKNKYLMNDSFCKLKGQLKNCRLYFVYLFKLGFELYCLFNVFFFLGFEGLSFLNLFHQHASWEYVSQNFKEGWVVKNKF